MDPRPILTTKAARKMVADGKRRGIEYSVGKDFMISDHCIAKWGTRTCVICYKFIKRRDQRCR